jgi:hypothetical protein
MWLMLLFCLTQFFMCLFLENVDLLRLLKERKLVSALVSHVHWVCLACAVWY